MQNLTGTWNCNDGGTYYITQIENTIYLSGSARGWYNVGYGVINIADQSIALQWADTPNSAGFGNSGLCYLDASQNGVITKKAGNPTFGIGNFTKIS